MPIPLSHHDPGDLLDAERDIRSRLAGEPFDFEAMLAISNIYRAATAVRNRMEREVLSPRGLSWGGFTILFVLWVWGDRETSTLAGECGLAKGTLSGMLNTLEKGGLVARSKHPEDGRRVVVGLRPAGIEAIEEVFPEFNRREVALTAGLDSDEVAEMARLLRVVTTTAAGEPAASRRSDD